MQMNRQYLTALITIAFLINIIKSSDLQVTISSPKTSFAKTDNVQITVQYQNKGQNDLLIDNWFLMNGDLLDPTFKVTRDNTLVRYMGPLYKRKAPTEEDSFRLQPGDSVNVDLNIGSAYNLTQSGSYSIEFDFPVSRLIVSSRSTSEKLSSDQNSELKSNSIDLSIEGRTNDRQQINAVQNSQSRANTISYTSCSSTQTNQIATAKSSAVTYANGSFNYLQNRTPGSTPRYGTWFGAFRLRRWNRVKSHFQKIRDALVIQSLAYDCSCTRSGVFAYVYPNSPYTVYLCPAFWQASNTGTDSRAGTIIHEMSHFTILGGTDDHTYGQDSCQSLARTNPYLATFNADSHEYFVENNPTLT